MYAIVEIAGKQFKLHPDDTVKVPLLSVEEGKKVEFDRVLVLNDNGKTTFGTQVVKGKKVVAEVVEHGRDRKVIVFKMKRRKNYRKKNGHRQNYTRITVKSIG